MANFWNSYSISSFFKTSLGNKSTAFDGFYSSLGDAKMIKNGSYKKLMKSYYATMKEEDKTTTDSNANKKKEIKKKDVLNELLNKNTTYKNDGTKNSKESVSKLDVEI